MLEFEVKNQTIKRIDRFNPATDSVDYLTAKFNFTTADWDGYSKTAIFRLGTESYCQPLDRDNKCKVPYEVLVASEKSKSQLVGNNKIFVSVFGLKGTSRIPTNEIRIDLNTSGYAEGETPKEPTPDAYAQYVEQVRQLVDEVNTPDQEYTPESEAGQSGKAVTQGIEQHNTNPETHTDIRKALTERANALKGNASGEVVRVDDISPVEHNATVKISGKNLFKFSKDYNLTSNGMTCNISKNTAELVLNGTTTKETSFMLSSETVKLSRGTYTVSLFGANIINGTHDRMYVRDVNKEKIIINQVMTNTPKTFTVTEDTNIHICLILENGSTYDNARVSIQIEQGDTATEYEPYIDPSSVTVTRCGKNLWGYKPITTVNGVTITTDENGRITFNGACTKDFVIYETISLNKGVYTLSDNASGNRPTTIDARTQVYIPSLNVDARIKHNDASNASVTFELSENATDVHIRIKGAGDFTYSNYVISPMLECGDTVTEYDVYKEAETYTPDANGNCEITSLAPTMTLLTDTAGVTIDLEYNKDINAENEAVRADITELDNTVAEHTVLLGDVETALDNIIAIQTGLIGG